MNPYTNQKKLTMDEARKDLLVAALKEAQERLPVDMQRIYTWVIEKAEHMFGRKDRIMLTAAEMEITTNALRRYEAHHGTCDASRIMLLQLTHTRKEFQNLCLMA